MKVWRRRWVHWLACLPALAAVPLLFLGAEVTTKGVGMADQRPLVSPVDAIREMATTEQSLGWKIEHTHRLAGWFVGLCGIVMTAALWWKEPRRWVCWLGSCGLMLIVIQGLLGIFRIKLNALWGQELAWIHGCFAQVVFAALVSVALVTSPRLFGLGSISAPAEPGLRRWVIVAVALVYVQLVLGGMVRHQGSAWVARLHLVGAFVVLGVLVWLIKLAMQSAARAYLRGLANVLLALIVLQVILGVEAWFSWMTRFFVPLAALEETAWAHWLRSAHYLVGALILATTVALAWLTLRRSSMAASPPPWQEAPA